MKRSLVCIILSLIILFRIAPIAHSVSISGISAKAYVLIEADTGIIIASGNEHTALPQKL